MYRFIVLAFAVSAFAFPALAQKLGQTIDVGGWKISMASNTDGSTGCTATYLYDDKSIIAFSLDNDDTHMFLVSEPTAKMTKGDQVRMTYRIDSGFKTSGLGIAVSETMLAVPIPDSDVDKIYKAFQRGNSLFISLGKEEFEEPLAGSNDAIGGLSACQDKLPARGKK